MAENKRCSQRYKCEFSKNMLDSEKRESLPKIINIVIGAEKKETIEKWNPAVNRIISDAKTQKKKIV